MTSHSSHRVPLGVADPAAGIVYARGPQGDLLAISLSSGEILARTEFAATPLIADENGIIGWSPADEKGSVRVFRATRQDERLTTAWQKSLRLEDWVQVAFPGEGSFSLEAEIEGDRLLVTWEARTGYEGGAPPPAHIQDAATHHERRVVPLDRRTGAALGPGRPVHPIEEAEMELPDLAPGQQPVPYRRDQKWLTRSWTSGSSEAFLVRYKERPGIFLVRRIASTGAPESETPLTDDPAATASVTPDGTLIFLHVPSQEPLAWQAHSTETGTRIHSLPYDDGTESVAVVEDRVLYLVVEQVGQMRRRSLRCRSLEDPETKWSLLLEEEAVRQAPPPPR